MKKIQLIINNYLKFPSYILTHPINGFDQMKHENKGKLPVAFTLLFFTCLLQILNYQYLGFIVNDNNPQYLNSIRLISFVVVLLLLFAIGNWSITTLLDGKGKFKDIFMMLCYSLFPIIMIGYPNLLLSHIYTGKESSFYYIAEWTGIFLLVFLVFIGLLVVHEYTLLRTVATIFLTILAMAVIMFIILLLFSLAQQIMAFVMGLYQEITWRYF